MCPLAARVPPPISEELVQAGAGSARLDGPNLEGLVSFYLKKGLAVSTQKTYKAGQERYLKFCVQRSCQPLPLSQRGMTIYVSFLGGEGIRHSTIKVYLSAIRYLQIESGLGDPFAKASWPRLEYVLKGIKRNQAETGVKSKPRLPITPTILKKLKSVWEPNAAQGDIKMIWAACCLCFFSFLRCGKITVPGDSEYDPAVHLSFADVSFDHPSDPSVIQVHIKSSKTDPFRKGVFVYLGRTNADLCPVSALLGYLCARSRGAV